MVYVPAGCFVMGKDDASDDTYTGGAPFRMCFSESYWIDKTVVSNAAYQRFMDAGGYEQQGTWWRDAGRSWLHSMNVQRPHDYAGFTDPQQPRVGVMWYEADAYCRWRNARLPTEPEWEYAARGPDSLIYPWGNVFDPSKVVYAANSASRPAPVGSKPEGASWVGALDMSGNVLQWTSTAYEECDPLKKTTKTYRYPYPAGNDGRESATVDNQTMMVRGNSWDESNPHHLRTAFRSVSIPDQEYYRQISIVFAAGAEMARTKS
jgi:formylglycine-generating enzyme required for sulfatase activity